MSLREKINGFIMAGMVVVSICATAAELPNAERHYDFRAELERVHERALRDETLRPAANEFELTDGAEVALPADCGEVLENAARDFAEYLLVSMGVSARVSGRGGTGAVTVALDPSVGERTSRIETGDVGIWITASDGRTAAHALYHIEDMMSLRRAPYVAKGVEMRRSRFSPRMVHSGWGMDLVPENYMRRMAHFGYDALLVYVEKVGKTRSCAAFEDVNAIIRRAAAHGIDVYLYASVKAYVHPSDPGAQKVFDGTYGEIARAYPDAKGLILVFGDGKITLGDDAGFSTFSPYDSRLVISNNLEIAASETSTNVIESLNSGSSAGSAVKVYGNITGTGMIMFDGPRLSCELAGDNSEFRGVVYVKKDSIDRNGTHVGAERAASSNAVWNVYSSGSESFTKVEGGTFKFGSLSGSVYYPDQSNYKYQTLEVGHLGLDDSLGGQWFPSTYRNLVVDSNLGDRKDRSNRGHCLRKVGAGTLTFSGKYLRKYEINEGTLLITNNESFVWTKDESTYRSRFTFGGGTLAFGGDVTEDPSSRIAYSTAPICFSNAVGEVHTWATALDSSNKGGLVKKGEGTLTLTAAPLYTGDTYLDGGTLKMPMSASVTVKTHEEGKSVRVRKSDDSNYRVYTLGPKVGPMVILF